MGGPPGGAWGQPPQGYGPPMGYGAPMGPGMAAPPELQSKVNTWFILSIVSIFCGCGLFGIINVIYASGAKSALATGNFAVAESKINTAKTLCIIGYVMLPVVIALNVLTHR